mmetsp:Transcript_19455/g.40111  ORF Transcript_19455/g.40111 Transcript_19455/m.40111 type:complete len:139 (+) Transcript_19455:745-1161(+)
MVERDSKLMSLESIPGKWIPAALTRYPVVATIATRPCFNSDARNQRRVSSLPAVAKLRGSKLGMGAEEPPISSRLSESWVLKGLLATGAKAAAAPTRERQRAAVFIMTGYDYVRENIVSEIDGWNLQIRRRLFLLRDP